MQGIVQIESNGEVVGPTNPLPIAQKCSSGAPRAVTVNSTAATTVLAATASRLGAWFMNTTTVDAYLCVGGTAAMATGSYTIKLLPGDFWAMPLPIHPGLVSVILASGDEQSFTVQELV